MIFCPKTECKAKKTLF
jgi:hypothetical protein